MQDAHEKDEEKLKQLEYLLADQRIEQRRMEIIWEEERKTMELKAVRQTQEVKDLAAKEVAAAQLAKEAAQLALNVEKLDAEKEARRKADAMVVEERKKAEDGHKSQLQRYEELIRGLQEQQLNLEQDVDRPIRRTRIAEGNRSVDVTEYATSKRASPLNSSSSPLHDSFARLHMGPNGSTNHSWSQRSSRHDSFRSSLASLQSSRTSLGSTSTAKSQQMIVLPVKTDRQSQRIAELKSSLAGFGIESVFEDSEESQPFHMCQILPYTYDDMSDQIVRSTIFWEASALSLGSELLLTMRQAGWRPTYTRISGNDSSLKSNIYVLTPSRERSNTLSRKSAGSYLFLQPWLQTAILSIDETFSRRVDHYSESACGRICADRTGLSVSDQRHGDVYPRWQIVIRMEIG
jgi:hypothetical protein